MFAFLNVRSLKFLNLGGQPFLLHLWQNTRTGFEITFFDRRTDICISYQLLVNCIPFDFHSLIVRSRQLSNAAGFFIFHSNNAGIMSVGSVCFIARVLLDITYFKVLTKCSSGVSEMYISQFSLNATIYCG